MDSHVPNRFQFPPRAHRNAGISLHWVGGKVKREYVLRYLQHFSKYTKKSDDYKVSALSNDKNRLKITNEEASAIYTLTTEPPCRALERGRSLRGLSEWSLSREGVDINVYHRTCDGTFWQGRAEAP